MSYPAQLRRRPQWVCWRWGQRDGKPTKLPLNPRTGRTAKTNDATTWTSYDEAAAACARVGAAGLGYVLTGEDGVVFVDFDGCRDRETGAVDERVLDVLRGLDTYVELSVSKTGLHALLVGHLPACACHKKRFASGHVELYETGRFVCMTGERLEGAPDALKERQKELEDFYAAIVPGEPTARQRGGSSATRTSDLGVVRAISSGACGEKARRLWAGDTSDYDGDASSADLALCNYIVREVGDDAARLDHIFRQSGLMRRKWDERHDSQGRTYGEMTVAKALEGLGSTLTSTLPADTGKGIHKRTKPFNLTELGNAERLAKRHQTRIAAVTGHGLVGYDPRRGIFTSDHAVLVRYAKETVRSIYEEAGACRDAARRRAIDDHARRSESRKAIDNMLALVVAEEAVEAEIGQFDAEPDLLNTGNGVVDLRSGELCRHSPDYRMTKVTAAAYRPAAPCPVWRAHLERIFAGDGEIIAFLQRLFGYALTGHTAEQVFALFHGGGANGKGMTVNTWSAALGDYARATPITTFGTHTNDAIRNDLAALAGARLVTASETRPRRALDESTIKQLTGQDPISARFLHREFFTYLPQFLIVLSTNHKPRVECPDYAIKRRVLLVPFEVTIPEEQQDKQLGKKLRAELDGILTWGVEGAVQYLADGLGVPARVRAATEAYRQEMDPLSGLRECCTFEPNSWTSTANMRAAIVRWCGEEGVAVELNHKELADWLSGLGCESHKHSGVRGWRGIRCDGVDSVQLLFDDGAPS